MLTEALRAEEVHLSRNVAAASEEAAAYLKGETLEAEIPEEAPGKEKKPAKGWALVTVDGYSLGWGKLTGGILKNHYPKGLRK